MQRTLTSLLFISLFIFTCGFTGSFNASHYGVNGWVNSEMRSLESETHINPEALRTGLEAYATAHARGMDHKEILTIIDFSEPSTAKRMWVFDLRDQRLLFNTWVSHGRNSGDVDATSFSNANSSLKSSIGVFVTTTPYVGHDGYSLRVTGLEPGINDHAMSRDIVFHGADYVNAAIISRYGRIGRSWGCFAVNKKLIDPIVNDIKNNTVVVAYYPDRYWLNHSQFLVA